MKGPVRARVEVPRGSFVKRELHGGGGVDFVSPLPCPFNYGYLPGYEGQDGDPADAVIMGRRLPLGEEIELPVVARVRFVDAGQNDCKWVLSASPLRPRDRLALATFFRLYAHAKTVLNKLRGKHGRTAYLGLDKGGD